MEQARVSVGVRWAWIVITLVAWPIWHWSFTSLSAYPLSWLASVTPSTEVEPVGPGGMFGGGLDILILAAIGPLSGFVGVYLMRRLGAPQVVWIPAAIVSAVLNLGTVVFWAGFSGSGTGATHITGQFAITAALSVLIGVGAWLGAHVGVRLTSAST